MYLNLNFRPPSYWDHPDPVSAILSNIKGQNRRQMIAAVITGRAPAHVGEIPSGFLEASLDDSTRAELGAAVGGDAFCIGWWTSTATMRSGPGPAVPPPRPSRSPWAG